MLQTTNLSDQDWMEFIGAHPDAMIFHHPAWIKSLADSYGYRPFIVGVRSDDNRLRAGIPVMEINSPLTGRRWVSLPFSDFCSPLYTTDNEEVKRQIAENILALAKDARMSDVELRGIYSDHSALLEDSHFVTHEVPLESDTDKVFSQLHSMHRRNVKTARSKDVQIVWGNTREHLEEFYKLHLHSRRRQGVPIQPWKFFDTLRKNLFEQNLGFLLLAYHNQQCIAGSVFLHWQKTLTYKYGASLPDENRVRPSNLVMWTAIEWGCNNGFEKLDLGRTAPANKGLRAFKERWGAQEYPVTYTHLANHKKKAQSGRLMDILSMIIRKSPLWVCRLTGELLYGHFG
jgi:CelD/BcsL family acetyltransferase involved in cellulose biosynthesis